MKKLTLFYMIVSIAFILVVTLFLFHEKENKKAHFSIQKGKASEFSVSAYWVSWAQNNADYVYSKICQIPDGIQTVLVAFALEKKDYSGLELQVNKPVQLQQGITLLHQRGIEVLLSTGGAIGIYPWRIDKLSDKAIARQYIEFVNTFGFDGIDFDVEKGSFDRLIPIIKEIKLFNPKIKITFTVPLHLNGLDADYNHFIEKLYKNIELDQLFFMNYNHYASALKACSYQFSSKNLLQNCYIKSLNKAVDQIKEWLPNENKVKKLVINGVMIGCADDGECVSADEVKILVHWLKENGYAGIMLWAINRDQPSCTIKNISKTTGIKGIPIGTYISKILNTI